MGCSSSISPRLTDVAISDLSVLGFTSSELTRLQVCYDKIDVNHNGHVDINEVYAYFNLDENPYLYHIFHQVKRSFIHEITLREFILCIYFFLIRDQEAIIGTYLS